MHHTGHSRTQIMHDVHASGFRPMSECAFEDIRGSLICAAHVNEPVLGNSDRPLSTAIGLCIIT
jgi:hypothetical protein